ncbi:TOMM precursor leader peptide-binding protein [Plantactinospora sp. GCM10030261]|uniref:TOMM precursor leader peptide-binding protein n=1 Tax=Plantactinospora sp. GCM10030261 TaxID=3273420 RepID=UPI00361AD464
MTRREAVDAVTSAHCAVSGAFADALITKLEPALNRSGYAVSVAPTAPANPERGEVPTGPSVGILVADHDDPAIPGFRTRWRRSGRPLLDVVHQHPDIRIGPWDISGTSACGSCFRMRARQHGSGTTGGPPLRTLPSVSIDGFPPYVTSIVVTLVLAGLERLTADPAARRNEVTMVDTALLTIRTLPVIPVNGCPQCAAPTPPGPPLHTGLNGATR